MLFFYSINKFKKFASFVFLSINLTVTFIWEKINLSPINLVRHLFHYRQRTLYPTILAFVSKSCIANNAENLKEFLISSLSDKLIVKVSSCPEDFILSGMRPVWARSRMILIWSGVDKSLNKIWAGYEIALKEGTTMIRIFLPSIIRLFEWFSIKIAKSWRETKWIKAPKLTDRDY